MNKLMLLDGNSIMNRAFYAIPILTTKEGHHTNAIYGFLNILFKYISEENPSSIGVVFDLPKPTFRHLKYSEYKGNRKKSPDELRCQFPTIKEILKSMKIDVYEKEGFEADDLLGTIAKLSEKSNEQCIIISGDRDLLQIATDNIKIKIPTTKQGKTVTENYFAKDVIDIYGLTPDEFVDYKALMGDTSDNIPGVPSIGDKTASKIIKEYKTVENAIENASDIKPKRASENLITFKEQALLSKFLVTIKTDVKIEYTSNNNAPNIFNQDFLDMCKKYELNSLISKFSNLVNDKSKNPSNEKLEFEIIEDKEDAEKYISSLIKYISTNLINTNEFIAYKMIYDDDIFIGISITTNDNDGTFIKMSDNFKEETLIEIFKPFFESNCNKITLDAKTDIVFLNKYNINLKNVIFDIMLAGYILNPSKNKYEFHNIASDFLNIEYPSKEILLGKATSRKKKFLLEIEKNDYLQFACNHSNTCFKAFPVLKDLIKENNQENLFYNIEMPLISVLASMQTYGIEVSKDELIKYQSHLEKELSLLTKQIYDLSGEKFNINSPKQLGEILFTKLQLKGGKKIATGWSTSADILEKIKNEHEIIDKILMYRTYAKLKSTYADGLINLLDENNNRIYSNFNQTATATGRLSSTEPNLQNIPIKLEFGKLIRRAFKPKKNYVFIDADYSQIELRILAHFSNDQNLIKAFNNGEDIHSATASKIFNKPLEEVTTFERSAAKAINFGLIYGKQAFTLSQDLGITKKEAENYISEYFDKYPNIKTFLDDVVEETKELGYASTMFNRIRYIPEINSSNFIQRGIGKRTAMNMPIQGTAADIMKIAMIKVHNRIEKENLKSRLLLQVHDELLIETWHEEIDIIRQILKDEMENAVKLAVDLSIDIHQGDNWYDAK